jgi:Ca2+-binding EF-hand superfamily protein
MVIRSHECVRKGFDLPFSGANKGLLATIFSASNYCGGNNDAAYMVFAKHKMSNSHEITNSELVYTVHHYNTSEAQESLKTLNNMSLHELILKKKKALLHAFEAADGEASNRVTKLQFADIMVKVTKLNILWLPTIKALSPDSIDGNWIDYVKFLNSCSPHTANGSEAILSMDDMYGQRARLEAVFKFFDKDGNGTISREEFKLGCDFMNTTLPPENQLKDYDHVLNLMDFDNSDSIDINEFFEVMCFSLYCTL